MLADPRQWTVADVQDWIESIGLYEYRETFLEGHIEGNVLLGMNAAALQKKLLIASAEHAALLETEVAELKARRGLFSDAELRAHLAAHPLAEGWSVDGVGGFLREAGLAEYVSLFAEAHVDGRMLLQMGEREVTILVSRATPDAFERHDAAAEQIVALIAHLRWRSRSLGSVARAAFAKQEL